MRIVRITIFIFFALLSSLGTVYAQDVIITGISSTPVSCGNGSDGTLTVSVSGGVGQYTYLLVQGAVAVEGAGPMTASTYTFTGHVKYTNFIIIVSDQSSGTTDGFSFGTIGGPDPISITSVSTSDISCNNVNDGSITVSAIGEQGNYTFDLNGPQTASNTSGTFPGLQEGDYTVTVGDANGCPSTDVTPVLTISNPPPVTVTVNGVTPVSCYGEATGAIGITPGGGSPGGGTGYTYQWTGPNGFVSNAEDISMLEAGDYFVIVSDGNGCQASAGPITITTNTAINSTFILTNITCNGLNNGAIQTTISGGTPNYTYSWTGPLGFSSPNEDISDLLAGVYQLTVSDALGCIEVMPPQTVSEPPLITATVARVNVDCFGAANGSINLSPAGGVAPYLFAWTGPGGFNEATEDISMLGPGEYSVNITDANGCIVPFPAIATILEPAEVVATPVKTDISCGGLTDGSIDITVAGGTLPYTFNWSGPGGYSSNNQDIAGLAAGAYNLVITDGNGCVTNFPLIATIIEPTPISAILSSQTNILCNGEFTGAITIDVSGGTGLLIFDWTNEAGVSVSADEDPVALPAGVYSLSITDANGCNILYPDLATISEPPALASTLTETPVTCYGNGDGTITVTTSGGTGSYEYSITGNLDPSYQAGNVFSGLGPGLYTVWTRDANLCVVSNDVTILEPGEIQILEEIIGGQNLCFGDALASINISVSGGVPPYLYSINGGADLYPTNLFNNLAAGDYQILVRDASGCEIMGSLLTIIEPAELFIDNYVQGDVNSCFDSPEGSILISAGGGTDPKTYSLNGSITNSTGDFQNLPAGPYDIHISDRNACILDTSVLILGPPPIVVDNTILTDVTACSGDASGAIIIAGSGGTGTINYSLDGGSFQASGNFVGLLAGSHTITLRDDNACTLDTLISLSEPAPLVITSEELTPISCAGAADGVIEIFATGGTAPLKFTLNPGGTTNATGGFGLLAPGAYTVELSDVNGCGPVSSSLLTLADPPVFVLESVSNTDITCNGADDGSIEVRVSGGIPPYQYSVDNQASWLSESSFNSLPPGSYEVYARDANLCTLYAGAFTMTDPVLLTISANSTDITTCSGDTSGLIEITAGGGTGVLLYSINGTDFQASGTFTNLPAGEYTASVMDESGCTATQPVSILEPAPVMSTIIKTDATYGNLGSINFTETSGGTLPYEYSIEGPGGTFSTETFYDNLEVGSYHALVRDANACTYEEMVIILDVLPLDVVVNVSNISCFGASDGMIEMLPQDAEGAVEYSIDAGATFAPDGTFDMLAAGTYILVAKDAAGKVFLGTAEIREPAEISLSSTISPAECNAFSETGGIQVSVSGGTPGYSYLWSDGSTLEDRDGIRAGTYSLITTDANNCMRYDTMLVNSLVIVDAYAGRDTTICYASSVQLYGEGGHTASWSPSTFLSDPDIADPIAIDVTETTSYVLTISEKASIYECFNTDTVTIAVYPLTGVLVTPDTFIIRGESIELEAVGGPFSSYRWEPAGSLDNSTIPNPIASPQQSTTYTVYAMNENSCEESDMVFLEVIEDIMAYNVFSPNGDGINDFFDIKNADRFPEILVEVYSRWGDMLFQSTGYSDDKRWDGRTRGTDAPLGTYYYIIIPYSGAKPITGNVTIIR